MWEKRILNVVGARPNFMKIAPLMRSMQSKSELKPLLVNTGQHYDYNMSAVFFKELGLPPPDYNLGIGSGSHAVQTAGVMVRFEELCLQLKPDAVLVVGDVNSTLACSLVAAKLNIPVGHVEAGLRSRDRSMPEEINRLVTDMLSIWLFTPSRDADENLSREGVSSEKIFFVGNIMIDTLLYHRPQINQSTAARNLGLMEGDAVIPYGLVTLHRPSNVDDPTVLRSVLNALEEIQEDFHLIFPVHPRTHQNLEKFGLSERCRRMKRLKIIEPMGYIDFVSLARFARFVLTDSGGLQEETTYLGVPCLTLRDNTERPVTVTIGTNELVKVENVVERVQTIQAGQWKKGSIPPLWDGATAERICEILIKVLG
jgi:UDP-N-acetylglucosamine 2-epimerase (non-hydrolysing)